MSNNSEPADAGFEALLNYIKRNRGFDFTGYKRSSLMRRVRKRMQELEIKRFSDYLDRLEVAPEEFVRLFNTVLINVTCFFRDRPNWDYLAAEIVPQIIARRENEPIRIWSAGCASGQEAYTIAMILAEALGIEQCRARVKIYATDVDEEALKQARYAIYSDQEVASIPPNLLVRYFESATDNLYTFRQDLRRSVIFGRHDLVQDAPISRVDLLVCRNTLMYFNTEAQAKIKARFHFALNDNAFLFLGKAEMLLSHSNSFTPVDLKCRIFTKRAEANLRDRLLLMSHGGVEEEVNYLANQVKIKDAAFDANPVAQVVVSTSGFLTLVNEQGRALLHLSPGDLGRPLQDLELSYRPVELRSGIEQVYAERRALTQREVEWSNGNETQYFDIQIAPLLDLNDRILGVSITYTDVSRAKRLQTELEHSNQELEMAYEELQSTNEELETTNEELQSSNEELETTNEELQSTNEELETMNEELQSSNEELQTMNEELRLRSDELNQANFFLESVLASLQGGVVVISRDLQVQVWNSKAEDLWGLRTDEVVGQHFLNLDIGLPVEQLRQSVRDCLAGESQSITLPATNRRGKAIACEVTCTPLIGSGTEVWGVIMLMAEVNVET